MRLKWMWWGPQPRAVTDVRSFHGLASYRRFVSHFSSIMAPITNCMKGGKFTWTDEAESAFQEKKQHLTTTLILIPPDFTQAFELHSDASKIRIGVILSRNGRPVAFTVRSWQMQSCATTHMMCSMQCNTGGTTFSTKSSSFILIMIHWSTWVVKIRYQSGMPPG